MACQQVRSGQVHRVANLFGHTGAFSVACAAAGAQETATVDLSRRYLDWARTNFEANSLDPTAHRFVQAGSLEWLQQDSDLWDLMILDPPSHASGSKGAKGWSLKRDYETLVASAARRLTPRGWILACANHKGLRPSWLRRTVESGLRRAGRSVKAFLPAPPSPDFPRKKGFPEGRPFAGFWIQMHD